MTYLEQAIYIAFIERINNKMNTMDTILDDARKTAETIAEIKKTMVPNNITNLQKGIANMQAGMAGIQPPVPMGKKRVSSNEGLLQTEIETLKEQMVTKDEALKNYDERLGEAYNQVEAFREEFEQTIAAVSEKVFTLQNSIYEVLSKE